MLLVLASSSPARLRTLRRAGTSPRVVVPDVDEEAVWAPTPAALVQELARLKAGAALAARDVAEDFALVACDSLLELDGRACGKPHTPEAALTQWRRMRGRSGVLHTGHHVVVQHDGDRTATTRLASTVVHFADPSDEEVAAYVATGEPLPAAGAFSIDGFGGPYVRGLEGDPHNVVGISLPVLREALLELGVAWHTLWGPPQAD